MQAWNNLNLINRFSVGLEITMQLRLSNPGANHVKLPP
jgi:hypothetical protein